MFARLPRRETHPPTAARLRRITAALAAVTGVLLAWAAAVPAASAAILIPDPGAGGAYGPVPATPASSRRAQSRPAQPRPSTP